MRTPSRNNSIGRGWPVLLAGTAAAVTSATHADAADWTKHFRVGMQVTLNIEAEFSGGGLLDLPIRAGRYDNGSVLPDATGDTDVTTFWGYNNDNQVDGQLVTFSRSESFTGAFGESKSDDSPYLGLELAYGQAFARWGEALIGWEAGYSFLPISISNTRSTRGTATVGRYTHEAPDGVIIPSPGPYQGPRSGAGAPVIGLDPVGDPVFENLAATARSSSKLDVSLHMLRAGPTIHLELARRWAVQGSLGPAIGYVTGDYEFNERLGVTDAPSQEAEGDFGGDDFVYGGYAQALLLFHFEDHGDIYAGLQFMGLTGSEFEEGDRRAKLNLGATLSFLVGVNWPF